MPTPTRPTRGQQRILDFASRGNRRLRGQRTASGEHEYRIVELSATPPPREVMRVTARMVDSLVVAGWIMVAQQVWEYRVTQIGIAAANA